MSSPEGRVRGRRDGLADARMGQRQKSKGCVLPAPISQRYHTMPLADVVWQQADCYGVQGGESRRAISRGLACRGSELLPCHLCPSWCVIALSVTFAVPLWRLTSGRVHSYLGRHSAPVGSLGQPASSNQPASDRKDLDQGSRTRSGVLWDKARKAVGKENGEQSKW